MKRLLFLLALSIGVAHVHAQKHGMGMIYNQASINKVPKKAELLTRAYTTLPQSYSLKKYCPTPQNQGNYQTCVGWASAYAARTIMEAIRNGWTSQVYINHEAYSPLFSYALAKLPNTTECNQGTYIEKAAALMKTTGAVKRSSLDDYCVNTLSSSLNAEAGQNKIDDYFVLFDEISSNSDAVRKTKKAIAENHPVVCGVLLTTSFNNVKDCWYGATGSNDQITGSHAMCVVGYDDNKYGGAFQLMNSWSTQWGDGGFCWITYKAYQQHAHCGLEFYLKPKAKATTTTTTTSYKFSGNISLKLSTGQTLKATLGTSNGFKRYRINQPLVSGSRYRIYVGNNEPGYVYVFSSDQQNNVAINFPTTGTSAALTYKSNTIALPGENLWLELDDTRGTDYLCILFSKYSVDTNSLLKHLRTSKGATFYEKVQRGFSKYLASQSNIQFSSSAMSFTATSKRQMVPMFIEFEHQ